MLCTILYNVRLNKHTHTGAGARTHTYTYTRYGHLCYCINKRIKSNCCHMLVQFCLSFYQLTSVYARMCVCTCVCIHVCVCVCECHTHTITPTQRKHNYEINRKHWSNYLPQLTEYFWYLVRPLHRAHTSTYLTSWLLHKP